MKGQSHPLCAAVTADSLRKGFDVGMEEPLGESDVTGLLTHPTVGNKSRAVSDFSLSKNQNHICCWLSRIHPQIKHNINSSMPLSST